MGHDMTPMAGGIANGEKYGLVLLLGQLNRLFAPGMPIDRIEGMLQKIGAFFIDEMVGLFPLLELLSDKLVYGVVLLIITHIPDKSFLPFSG
jgi:hypothetical protein